MRVDTVQFPPVPRSLFNNPALFAEVDYEAALPPVRQDPLPVRERPGFWRIFLRDLYRRDMFTERTLKFHLVLFSAVSLVWIILDSKAAGFQTLHTQFIFISVVSVLCAFFSISIKSAWFLPPFAISITVDIARRFLYTMLALVKLQKLYWPLAPGLERYQDKWGISELCGTINGLDMRKTVLMFFLGFNLLLSAYYFTVLVNIIFVCHKYATAQEIERDVIVEVSDDESEVILESDDYVEYEWIQRYFPFLLDNQLEQTDGTANATDSPPSYENVVGGDFQKDETSPPKYSELGFRTLSFERPSSNSSAKSSSPITAKSSWQK